MARAMSSLASSVETMICSSSQVVNTNGHSQYCTAMACAMSSLASLVESMICSSSQIINANDVRNNVLPRRVQCQAW